jgi:hypothetical protein
MPLRIHRLAEPLPQEASMRLSRGVAAALIGVVAVATAAMAQTTYLKEAAFTTKWPAVELSSSAIFVSAAASSSRCLNHLQLWDARYELPGRWCPLPPHPRGGCALHSAGHARGGAPDAGRRR